MPVPRVLNLSKIAHEITDIPPPPASRSPPMGIAMGNAALMPVMEPFIIY